ncbi:MAG: hypothetical protein ACRC33_12275 [Gemmataceae bacterium]
MTVLLTLMAACGLWSAWSLLRALWSIFLPRSAWRWDRGAEIKGAEPSFFGLVSQIFRGLRYLMTAAAAGGLAWFFYHLAYGQNGVTP